MTIIFTSMYILPYLFWKCLHMLKPSLGETFSSVLVQKINNPAYLFTVLQFTINRPNISLCNFHTFPLHMQINNLHLISFNSLPCSEDLKCFIKCAFYCAFQNMQTLKFKSQLMFAFFTAVNHFSGRLRKNRSLLQKVQKVMVCDL